MIAFEGRRTKKTFDLLVSECEKEDIDFDVFLAHLGRRYYSNGKSSNFDKSKVEMFDHIINKKDPFSVQKLSGKEGLYIMESLEIGHRRYTNLRKFLEPHCHLPNTDVVREAKNEIVPKQDFEPMLDGLWYPLPKLVKRHTTDILEDMVQFEDESVLKEIEEDGIIVKGGGGFDVSGRHSTFR